MPPTCVRLGRLALLQLAILVAGEHVAAAGAAKPIIAIFDIEDRSGSLAVDQVRQLTDYLTSKVAASGVYAVIPSSQIRQRLRLEQLQSYRDCYDQKCQIALGRELAANRSLSTRVMKLGEACTVTAVVFDLRKMASEGGASAQGPCTPLGLTRALDQVTGKLASRREQRRGDRRAAPKLLGGLLLKSVPSGAQVWLDGVKQKGQTPLTLSDLPAEEHLVRLKKGGLQYRAMARVRPDDFTKITATLERPGVRLNLVSTPPEAEVLLDGKPVGVTPLVLRRVPPGRHMLLVRRDGYVSARRSIALAPGSQRRSLALVLQRAAVLEVDSSPDGATVWAGQSNLGRTPVKVDLPPGTHALRVEHRRRATVRRVVELKPGKRLALRLRLDLSRGEKQRIARELKQLTRARARAANARRQKTAWGMSSLVLGLGFAAGAGALYGWGISQGERAHDSYMGERSFDQRAMDQYYGDVESAQTKLITGHVLAGLSSALLAWAWYELATRPTVPPRPRREDVANPERSPGQEKLPPRVTDRQQEVRHE